MAVDAAITLDALTLNGTQLVDAVPPATIHQLLGEPTRVAEAGPPAPHGHRNTQWHVYDALGICLNEHHFTHTICAVTFVLWPEESTFDIASPYTGRLLLGKLEVVAPLNEDDLEVADFRWRQLLGDWVANGKLHVSASAIGRRQKSGHRSVQRQVIEISVSLVHDPHDETHRPA